MLDNHNNICDVIEYSLVKNLDGGLPTKYNSLVCMSHLEDVFIIGNSLQGLQQLDSTHCSSMTITSPLTSKETRFVEGLKIASKRTNMFNERKDSNTKDDDKSVQTTRKCDKGMPKKTNTKSFKAKTSKN